MKATAQMRGLFAVAALSVTGFGLAAFISAERGLDESLLAVRDGSQIEFSAKAVARHTAFEYLDVAPSFRSGVVAEGLVWLAGPSGVSAVEPSGQIKKTFLVGRELPASKPTAIAVGLDPASGRRSVFVTTESEGFAIFALDGPIDSGVWRQVRPAQKEFRNLTAVLPLPTGQLLFGTARNGVLRYDGESLSSLSDQLESTAVTALAGNEAELWVGTANCGIFYRRGGAFEQFSEGQGLPDRRVLAIAIERDQTFVGTPLGVAMFQGGRFQRSYSEGSFALSLEVSDGFLRIGTFDEGQLVVPLGDSGGRASRRDVANGSATTELIRTGSELLVLTNSGAYSAALNLSGSLPWGEFSDRGLLTDGNVSALSFDQAGRLWVGYFDRGFDIVDLAESKARHVENDTVFCVNRIVGDPRRNSMAVATANGLALFDEGGSKLRVLTSDDGLIADHVTDVRMTASGMAVATPAGVTLLDAAGARSIYAFHGLVNNHVYSLAGVGGKLYAGTLGGLSVVEQGAVKAGFTTANSSLQHNWVSAIAADGADLFVGTYGEGVARVDSDGAWHSFAESRGAVVNPNAMALTPDRLYVGTLDRGLLVYDRAAKSWNTVTAGLPSLCVTALSVHQNGVYVGTDNGLVRVAESEIGR